MTRTSQLLVYNTNVYNKLYSTIVPLSQTGTQFIPPSLLEQFVQAVGGKVRPGHRSVVARLDR